jgi:hypothetical protein
VDVLARLLDGTTRGARRAAVIAVALAVGVLVGASALAGHPTRVVTVADEASTSAPTVSEHASAGQSHADEKADDAADKAAEKSDKAAEKSDKAAEKSDKADDKAAESSDGTSGDGVHGSCVSAVARDKDKVGGPHDNHGFAVSRAAHTCPNPQPGGTAGD